MYTHIVQILDWDFYIRSIWGYYLKFGDISAVPLPKRRRQKHFRHLGFEPLTV